MYPNIIGCILILTCTKIPDCIAAILNASYHFWLYSNSPGSVLEVDFILILLIIPKALCKCSCCSFLKTTKHTPRLQKGLSVEIVRVSSVRPQIGSSELSMFCCGEGLQAKHLFCLFLLHT
jgi:hypothetical protein